MNALTELQTYFSEYPAENYKITQHQFPTSSWLIMYVVKLPKNQYIHVHVNYENGNHDNDYTISLHLLNLDTGEKSRISSDFKSQSITEVLDQMRPSFEHQGDLDEL